MKSVSFKLELTTDDDTTFISGYLDRDKKRFEIHGNMRADNIRTLIEILEKTIPEAAKNSPGIN